MLIRKNLLRWCTCISENKKKKRLGKVISFWLQPPNRDKLISNLRKRGEKEEEIKERLIIAERELPFAKEYDYTLAVDDNLEEVAAEIKTKILYLI